MDLNGIVSGAIAAVNPLVSCTLKASAGYSTSPDGSRAPAYATPVTLSAQVQPLDYHDLQQVEGLNLNGVQRAIYLHGLANGVVRVSQDGGDLITISAGPNNGVYLVVKVSEAWPDWAKVICTLQDGD